MESLETALTALSQVLWAQEKRAPHGHCGKNRALILLTACPFLSKEGKAILGDNMSVEEERDVSVAMDIASLR